MHASKHEVDLGAVSRAMSFSHRLASAESGDFYKSLDVIVRLDGPHSYVVTVNGESRAATNLEDAVHLYNRNGVASKA